jgi:P27 family predicted phage terminase small subunit
MPGPPKTPTNLRLLRGNPGKEAKAVLRGEVQPRKPDKVPDPPERLKGEAREEWLRIAPELHRLGILTVADLRPLGCYCAAYGDWCEAEDAMVAAKADDPHNFGLVIETPSGGVMANPLVRIRSIARDKLMRYATEFGFTPASRTRVTGNAAADEPKPKFAGLLANQ